MKTPQEIVIIVNCNQKIDVTVLIDLMFYCTPNVLFGLYGLFATQKKQILLFKEDTEQNKKANLNVNLQNSNQKQFTISCF